MNPACWLHLAAKNTPDAPALFCGDKQVANYRQFQAAAAGLGAGLGQKGISAGDRVAIFMQNAPEYLVALYGIWHQGAIAVPINAKLHPKEARFILKNADVVLTICDDAHSQGLDQPTLMIGTQEWAQLCATPNALAPARMEADDVLWLFYTSGTTGRPKGVMITCANVASMCEDYVQSVDEIFAEDAILYAAPMSHGAGLYNFMHVMRGCRHIVPASGAFEPVEILELGKTKGPISMFAAPTMVKRLADHARQVKSDGTGLRTIVYAGGPMYEADILAATEQMGSRFVQIYGQGECPMGITALARALVCDRLHPKWRARLNSVGRAQSSIEIRIVADNGQDCAGGETGEIVVRGPTVMKGYWRNPKATARTLRDGWLWTGDIGFLDDEGYLTLIDRSKDVIISGGSNIYPREVEEVLLHHPDVSEAAVIGRPHPQWGEEVVAFVVGHAAPEELDALCLDHIARFKRPKSYVTLQSLPKNSYGKVLKTRLREIADQPDQS